MNFYPFLVPDSNPTIIQCVESTKNYYPPSGFLSCNKGYDTACGNIDATGNSIKSCANNTCTFTCPEGKLLHGIANAECNLSGGNRVVSYETNLNTGEAFSMISECVDTMCGDISSLNLQIEDDVVTSMNLTENGYGSINLKCGEGKVVAGLNGQSSVACLPNGVFDVIIPSAKV